ncbi:MAG TPA: malate dehydrogenase, partial [Planctomycetales bacterium]|nr:malate dehydrogenase [Planctomycetales bacterium]
NTQYPDFTNAKIHGKPAAQVITDRAWLETTFVPQVQNRGAAVIKARGQSSAMSAANGAIDHVKSLLTPT